MHLQWRKELAEGKLLGPRLILASPIVDGPKPMWRGSIAVSDEAEGRQAVARVKKDGWDFVNVYSFLPRDAYFAIADEAKQLHIPFAGHVPESITAAEASDAGQKSIEHLTGILLACSTQDEELRKARQEAFAAAKDPRDSATLLPRLRPLAKTMLDTYSEDKANALFARFHNNHTWQCPTLTVLRSFAFLDDPTFTNDARLKYMPASIRNRWVQNNDFRLNARTAEDYANARHMYGKALEVVGAMRPAGVEFLAGTDTLNPFVFPGFSLHDELQLLVEAGLTPMEALQAATYNPAKFLGMLDSLGTIEQGKIADLVLLEANPLQDIRNTQKINAVVVGGKLLPKSELQEMLARVEATANQR